MALTNRERIERGFEQLRGGLAPYAEAAYKKHLGGHWYEEVSSKLKFGLERDKKGNAKWDTQALLKSMIDQWQSVFRETLGHFERSLVGELLEFRNKWAHEEPFNSDDTLRALDSMQRLLQAVSAPGPAEQIELLKFELQRVVYAEQARNQVRYATAVEGAPKSGLRPWREVVTPHPDVATGQYMQAEFAADLHNVHNNIGSSEYTNPTEFFRRTFITDGLRELLSGALQRLSSKGGDPVVELQTNFGGGKTHSMLALYHMFGGTSAGSLPGLEPILQATKIAKVPKAKRAVLVGTHLSVAEVSTKPDGTKVRTLWGELAWQLGGKDGYKLVAESDQKSTSPGAAVFRELFRKHGPALVLIDEWVAYARNTVDRRDLPSGDFESQATFAQALTEAAKGVEGTLVVASVPASKIEVGGKNGEFALQALKDVFERVGVPWRPASADEGFEIVRRRLFEPIGDKSGFAARDAVIEAFARMYTENKADFPSGCSEATYRRKLEAAYPIHPDVFELLYGKWSTLDKFQRTRGVLRLLAKVINRLWESNDAGLLLMPSSLPMDDPAVKSELTRYLDDVWEPIISEDVDGQNSLPLELDRQNPNLGRYSACRRVARTLYLGTAPEAGGENPGIDDRRVKLGCTQPGENSSTFGDALRRISDKAKHIHQDQNRYWISTKSNLNRLADDRAASLMTKPEDLYAEIVKRIRAENKSKANRGHFAGVHPCPEGSSEVADDPEARLVILGPQFGHRKGQKDSPAMKAARSMLDQRGASQRINRNMIVFLAADAQRRDDLLGATAQYLAWRGILDEYESLNLDPFQQKQAETKVSGANDTVTGQIRETWRCALVPVHQEPAAGATARPDDLIGLDEIPITSGGDALAERTSTKLKNEEQLLPAMGGLRLRMELDRWLWKDKSHVSVTQLVEWFARYLYLPRIVGRNVLVDAIKDGLGQLVTSDTFAFASGYDETKGRYLGLQIRNTSVVIENGSLLVKPAMAEEQVRADAEAERKRHEQVAALGPVEPPLHAVAKGVKQPAGKSPEPAPVKQQPNVFVASVKLDGNRLGREAGKVAEEVVQHLSTLPGAEVEVTLEIHVRVPGGVSDDVARTVTENCNTLKFRSHGFERE